MSSASKPAFEPTNTGDEWPPERIANQFRTFAERVYAGASPLYRALALRAADDGDILALTSSATKGQPVPNLLFAAVHYLLLGSIPHPLAGHYPTLTGGGATTGDPYPLFRSFCLDHADSIRELVSTRRVQTNEVRRCACLLPAFETAHRLVHGLPLALVEIGASAGLNLLWDRYRYNYGEAGRIGHSESPVQIRCELRGERNPPLPDHLPPIASRIGIDLNPIDVRDPEQTLWLRALVWPEQTDRAALLSEALELARRDPPPLLKGDALDLLPAVLAGAPPDSLLCVFHSYAVIQFSSEARARLTNLIADAGRARDLVRIGMEWYRGEEQPSLTLTTYTNGHAQETLLAHCDQHGRWLHWLTGPISA